MVFRSPEPTVADMAEVYYHHFPISARFTFQRRLFGCLFQYIFANGNTVSVSLSVCVFWFSICHVYRCSQDVGT